MSNTHIKPILLLDFDGVCHQYNNGWYGADVIQDDAVPGLFEFVEEAAQHFDIQVFSTRSNLPGGIEAMQVWLYEQYKKWRENGGGKGFQQVVAISFPTEKPPAFIALDDRAILFTGIFPSITSLLAFKPWNKGGDDNAITESMNNDMAHKIGMVGNQLMHYPKEKIGDEIDRGLVLRRLLEEAGFTLTWKGRQNG